ncbi:MAG: radical SAM protein [Betaproteobacteria bacterium HGW-Betaproteobacteria-11]|nr:MAG: radical SAM protein [Betaproteobacteria bacterium HGW-Betaproteobacteria-11]
MSRILLTTSDHSRDSASLRYVYPVLSRRAGGVSVGINLNPNNACNWRCIYCQVPNLQRGGPPPIDLVQLREELVGLLRRLDTGMAFGDEPAAAPRELVDVAFSGNGEPTSAAEFPAAVAVVQEVLAGCGLAGKIMLRLITNGSLLDRRTVQEGIHRLGQTPGEVWFKVDAATAAGLARINNTRTKPEVLARRLELCAELAPTWVQTCLFRLDGELPADSEIAAYLALLEPLAGRLEGVYLYGLARPSMQKEAPRLGRLDATDLEKIAAGIRQLGLTVHVSP